MKKNTSDKIKSNIPERKLTSSLWVWKPIKDSELKSYHQINIRNNISNLEKKTIRNEPFKFNHNNIFTIKENKDRDLRTGHKEVKTTKKGL